MPLFILCIFSGEYFLSNGFFPFIRLLLIFCPSMWNDKCIKLKVNLRTYCCTVASLPQVFSKIKGCSKHGIEIYIFVIIWFVACRHFWLTINRQHKQPSQNSNRIIEQYLLILFEVIIANRIHYSDPGSNYEKFVRLSI